MSSPHARLSTSLGRSGSSGDYLALFNSPLKTTSPRGKLPGIFIDVQNLTIQEIEAIVWSRMQSFSEVNGRLRGLDLFRMFLSQHERTEDRHKLDEDEFMAAMSTLSFTGVTLTIVREILKRADPKSNGNLNNKFYIEYPKFVQSISNRDRVLAKAVEDRFSTRIASPRSPPQVDMEIYVNHEDCRKKEQELRQSLQRALAALEEANANAAQAKGEVKDLKETHKEQLATFRDHAESLEADYHCQIADLQAHIKTLESDYQGRLLALHEECFALRLQLAKKEKECKYEYEEPEPEPEVSPAAEDLHFDLPHTGVKYKFLQ